jgi:hypothetical protein
MKGRKRRDSAADTGVDEGRLSGALQTSTITTYALASRDPARPTGRPFSSRNEWRAAFGF